MLKFLLKRSAVLVLILIITSFLCFLLIYLSPSDAVSMKYNSKGISVSEEIIEEEKEALGINDPFIVQYGRWLSRILHNDFGKSISYNKSVAEIFSEKLGNTIILCFSSVILTLIISIPLAIFCAFRENKLSDYIIRILSYVGYATPSYAAGVFLMLVFAVYFKILPVSGGYDLKSYILPTLTLSIWLTGMYIQRIRAALLEELGKNYIFALKTRGIPDRVSLLKHVVPNAMTGVITMLGLSIGELLSGATVVETLFGIQGIAKMAVDAVKARDFPIILAYTMWMVFIFSLINFIIDVLNAVNDPQTRNKSVLDGVMKI